MHYLWSPVFLKRIVPKMIIRVVCFLLVVLTNFLFAQPKIVQSVFLIGDSGEPYIKDEPYGIVLRQKVQQSGSSSIVLYLGDNVYPSGLVDAGAKGRAKGEATLESQVNWIKGTGAQGIFIPGNHDWAHWGRRGFKYVTNQREWIDSLKDEHFKFLPENGCPGPVEIPLQQDAVLVILDTQWFLHQYDKPTEDSDCECKTTSAVLAAISDIFARNAEKRVIIAGHHPLITYGEHGGVFTFSNHVFPLRDINPKLYLPLPIIGSIYPLYRKLFGHIQDTAHPLYKEFAKPILTLLKANPGNVFVSGHEHALEYIVKDSSHIIVSGAGSKTQHVKKKAHAMFAEAVRGFSQLNFLSTGELEIIFYEVDANNMAGKEVYRAVLPAILKTSAINSGSAHSFKNQVVKVSASKQYHAGAWRKKMLGENYRKEWETEIEVPVLDISSEKGGLKILQRGGGQQTLSLRLEASDVKEYVVRSVEKYPEKAVPEMLRKTFAADLVQDQISASHPYAALVIPKLAEAVGIYHTNPNLVFIPDDSALGIYRKDFANTLAIFEERPADDWVESAFFGNSKKIINTSKVIESLQKDNDNEVDQRFVLKSRLFDMIIGDWDRHDDQWRWATIKDKKGNLFRPIPRDRDQAFFGNEGMIPAVWSRKWVLPKFEGFGDAIRWPSGLSYNARYFDRSFITELSQDDWMSVARELKHSLTDEAIDSAIHQWPAEIYSIHGEQIIRNLKSRRDHIEQYAKEHYLFLCKETEVVGSDKPETFVINRKANKNLSVKMFKISKDGTRGKKLYDRTFKPDETKEVRIFGQGGTDQFILEGGSENKIKVRLIGGDGHDVLIDSLASSANGKKVFFYDQLGDYTIANHRHVKLKTSVDPAVNEYDRKAFVYDRLAPLVIGNYNPDDGVFIGGGFIGIVEGFRKQPFKQRHIFLASVAPATRSFNFRYQGKFVEVIGKWNVEVDANLKSPNYVNNFFGWGNQSIFNKKIDDVPGINVRESIHYYRYRFEELRFDAGISRQFGKASIKFGPSFQRIEMEEPKASQTRFISDYANTKQPDLFNQYKSFGGLSWEVGVDLRNHPRFTRRGIYWITNGRSMAGINAKNNFASYESSMAFCHSFRAASRLVFAARIGAGVNTGKYQFYQAQILDGKTELRGFRKTRFYGDQKMYSNFEVRLRLLNFRSYLFPASFGVLAFHDLGRVWYKDDGGVDPTSTSGKSNVWHKSIGGGLWFTPFNLTVLSTEIGHSKEGNLFYVRLGFLF
jgi:hypothetical protein